MDDLQHFGIPGMKWGRKSAKQQTYLSRDYQRSQPYRNQDYRSLSTTQLKRLNERIKLEREYKDLNPSAISTGRNIATRTLPKIATATISAIAIRYATKGVEYLIKKKLEGS